MNSQSQHPTCTYFLFINSGSGGNLGKQMLENQVEKYEFRMSVTSQKDIRRLDVYLFDLRTNRDRGFSRLKHLNQNMQNTVAVVCGGDGTIMWVLSEFQKYNINPSHTPIAIIPLGTGNDFSRSLGWGGSPFLKWSTSQLKQLVKNWIEAEQIEFDLWDVIATVHQEGCFQKVSNQKDVKLAQKRIQKTFCNYFSFGIDGQIGYSFDKYRTNSKVANFAVYGMVGAFNDLQQPLTINQIVETLYETKDPQDDKKYLEGRLVLHTQNKKIYLHNKYNNLPMQLEIKQSQRNILALNINSYAGGTTDIWKNAKSGWKQDPSQVSTCDGQIQIVSFDSGTAIAMQKSFGGLAKKITQSPGPLRYDFKRFKQENHCTYLQIDGQFLRMNHPKTVVVKKSNFLGGRIKVLKNSKKKGFNPLKGFQDLFI